MKRQQQQPPRGCALCAQDEKLLYFTVVCIGGTFKIEKQHFTVGGKIH